MSGQEVVPGARELTGRFLEMLNQRAYDRFEEVLAQEIVTEWPQSKERVRGLERLRTLLDNYPGGFRSESLPTFVHTDEDHFLLTPMFTAVQSGGSGETAISRVVGHYPDGSDWYIINVATARDGKLVRLEQYFAPMYESPEWRRDYVEITE